MLEFAVPLYFHLTKIMNVCDVILLLMSIMYEQIIGGCLTGTIQFIIFQSMAIWKISSLIMVTVYCIGVQEFCNTPSPSELLKNRRYKTTIPAVTRNTTTMKQLGRVFSKRQDYVGHDAHAKELPPLLPQQPVYLQKASNVSLWQSARVISTTGENTSRSYVISTPDGAKYWQNRLMLQWRVIPDERLPVPPKANSINIDTLLVLSSESDSPQAHTPLSTNNNKVISTKTQKSPHKEGTLNEWPKRTIIKLTRYSDVNSLTNVLSV